MAFVAKVISPFIIFAVFMILQYNTVLICEELQNLRYPVGCLWYVGMVPYEPELVQLANGDVLAVRTWPCWGMDIKYGKNTDISYGPWADRQR